MAKKSNQPAWEYFPDHLLRPLKAMQVVLACKKHPGSTYESTTDGWHVVRFSGTSTPEDFIRERLDRTRDGLEGAYYLHRIIDNNTLWIAALQPVPMTLTREPVEGISLEGWSDGAPVFSKDGGIPYRATTTESIAYFNLAIPQEQ